MPPSAGPPVGPPETETLVAASEKKVKAAPVVEKSLPLRATKTSSPSAAGAAAASADAATSSRDAEAQTMRSSLSSRRAVV